MSPHPPFHSRTVILSKAKDLLYVFIPSKQKKQILRRCAPQNDIMRSLHGGGSQNKGGRTPAPPIFEGGHEEHEVKQTRLMAYGSLSLYGVWTKLQCLVSGWGT